MIIFLTRYFDLFEINNKLQGYDFLGIDLPRYGRQYLKKGYDNDGNEFNYVYDFEEDYFPSIDRALDFIKSIGYNKVVLMV